MRASRTPPPGYVPSGTVALEGNRRLLVWLNVSSLPLLVISLGGLALVALLPAPVAGLVLLGTVMNAASSTGDLFLLARPLRAPRSAVVEDTPTGMSWYVLSAVDAGQPPQPAPAPGR